MKRKVDFKVIKKMTYTRWFYNAGEPLKAIAAVWKVSISTVRRWLRETGVRGPIHTNGASSCPKP